MKSTYFYFIQIHPTAIHHPNKMVSIQFIKKNINSHTACRCTKNIRKDVNVCKHIHHHSNNLEQEIKYISLKENIMHCMTWYQNKFQFLFSFKFLCQRCRITIHTVNDKEVNIRWREVEGRKVCLLLCLLRLRFTTLSTMMTQCILHLAKVHERACQSKKKTIWNSNCLNCEFSLTKEHFGEKTNKQKNKPADFARYFYNSEAYCEWHYSRQQCM